MNLSSETIESRITHHPPSDRAKVLHQYVRLAIDRTMRRFAAELPNCREASLAITKLEEAMFWANAAIARHTPDPNDAPANTPAGPLGSEGSGLEEGGAQPQIASRGVGWKQIDEGADAE